MRNKGSFKLLALSVLGICLSLTSLFVNSNKSSSRKVSAEEETSYGFNLDAETPDALNVVALSSNSTSTSHSLSLKFTSSTSYLYTSSANYKGVFISSEDAECPNDKTTSALTTKYDFDPNDPKLDYVEVDESGEPVYDSEGKYTFIPDKDGITHNYKALVPYYDGYVFRFEPSDSAKFLVVPYIVNRFDRYRVKVSTVAANTLNYLVSSKGKQSDNLKKVEKIIVGPNITRVDSGAFHVTDEHKDQVEIDFIGSEDSITFGQDWTNVTKVNFNYNLDDSGLTAAQIKEFKNVFNMDVEKDENDNPVYYDDLGYLVDAEGNYLKVEGKEKYTGELQTNYGCKIVSFNTTSSKSSDRSFVFGDYENNRPMVLEYKVKDASENVSTRYYEFPYSETTRGVGDLSGKKEETIYCEFNLSKDEKVVDRDFTIRNLFQSEAAELKANLSVEYRFTVNVGYTDSFDISEFVSTKKYAVETFGGYTAFTVTLDKVEGIYEKLKPATWASYKDKVESGNMKIRYLFTGFNLSTYKITFEKNGQLVEKEVSFNDSSEKGLTLNFHVLTKDNGNKVTFLIKNSLVDEDFNQKSVRKVEYKAVSFKLDLMSTKKGTTQIVTKSDIVTRFGYFDIYSQDSCSSTFDGIGFIVLFSCIYIALFIAYTIGYYFYAKKAFKNDEFRRMNDKVYFKKMAIILFEGLLALLGILFTIVRFGFFNTSVIVFNPVDPFVIIFDVIAIVIIGIFIKNITKVVKANKARRISLKLKLNEDVTEDGTN